MKKQVAEYIRQLGGTSAYSGKDKVMYINDPITEGQSIEECVLNKFGYGLAFKLKTN